MKILLIDDEASVRGICERVLRSAGHDVATSSSAEEATARLKDGWDIILTDINMSGSVDGLELLRRAKEAGNADVLIMTGSPELELAIRALQLGAYDFIVKPFGVEVLQAAIRRCVEKRESSMELAREKARRADLERTHAEMLRIQKVTDAFGLFVTPEVAKYALALLPGQWKKGSNKRVTVLFADVRKFTPFAGGISPEAAVDSLNQMFACIIPCIQNEGGILNKFMGDGILALFGAPLDLNDHERAAARAALSSMESVEDLARASQSHGLPPLHIGIGVNTGEVIAGCLGTQERAEYSVIGHTVNLASRLNAAAAPGQILIGADTAKALGGVFQCRPAGPVSLPGIAEPGVVWELLGSSLQISAAELRNEMTNSVSSRSRS